VQVHVTLIYLHKIINTQNIPRKAHGSNWNLSWSGSGPRAGHWGRLGYKIYCTVHSDGVTVCWQFKD